MTTRARSFWIAWRRVIALLPAIACSLLGGCRSSRLATSTDETFFEPLKSIAQPAAVKSSQFEASGARPAWDKKADSLLLHQKNQEQRITALSEQLELLAAARQGARADSSAESNKPPTQASKPLIRNVPAAALTYEDALRHYKAGNYQKALEEFQELMKRGIQKDVDEEYDLYIGVSQYHLNQFDQAIATLRRVVDAPRAKNKADAYYVLGLASMRLGNTAQARTMFESVLKEFPSGDLAAAARKKLSGLPVAK
jgi:TolA-binding protein